MYMIDHCVGQIRNTVNTFQQEIIELWDQIALLCNKVEDLSHCPVGAPSDLGNEGGTSSTHTQIGSGSGTYAPGMPQSNPQPVPVSASNPTIKLAKPNKFDGTKREELSTFEMVCCMYLTAVHPTATADQKVAFIMSFLDRIARDWLEPFTEQDILQG